MKPITEYRQQELIEHCKRVMGESSPDGLEYPIAEIALASLTAGAFGEVCGVIGAKYDVVRFAGESPIYHGDRVYTAPPVPVIKLPGSFQDAFEENNDIPSQTSRCGDGYCSHSFNNWKGQEFMSEFRGFIKGVRYVKRLNGIKD